MMENEILAAHIDHTLLKADATRKEIEQLCREAAEFRFAAVCVNPSYVKQCTETLFGTPVHICSVVGFPLGASTSDMKMMETMSALDAGASEIDMVIHIGALKSGLQGIVEEEISVLARACRSSDAKLKVIIETCLLTREEKILMCKIVTEAGAHFIKTSTGFSHSGATIEDVRLLREYVGSQVRVKASGGIKTRVQAIEMIRAGADRIGTSSGVQIIREGVPGD